MKRGLCFLLGNRPDDADLQIVNNEPFILEMIVSIAAKPDEFL